MYSKVPVTGMIAAVKSLEEKGLVWPCKLRCQVCGSDDDVYETHRDLIDASRQVSICVSCLVATAMKIDNDAF